VDFFSLLAIETKIMVQVLKCSLAACLTKNKKALD